MYGIHITAVKGDYIALSKGLVTEPSPHYRHVSVAEFVSSILHDMKREFNPQQLPGILKQLASSGFLRRGEDRTRNGSLGRGGAL